MPLVENALPLEFTMARHSNRLALQVKHSKLMLWLLGLCKIQTSFKAMLFKGHYNIKSFNIQ